jgi:PhzF family phenazine biosynthesis protein
MGQRIITVDAFTDRPFAGNPAAVCVLEAAADEGWKRDVAREMNLSETAFLHPDGDAYRLRWLTPTVEVDLCGHATLASAHVLWEDGHLDPAQPARFLTRSGPLAAVRQGDRIELDFPAQPPQAAATPPGLAEALGADVEWFGLNGTDGFAVLGGDATVRGLSPDVGRLAAVPVRGLIVTAASDDPAFDFVSRFFAPNAGIAEDPVTGSAHCALGPYWGERLGKADLKGYQASARGGVVGVGLRGERVALRGRAVTVVRGELVGG